MDVNYNFQLGETYTLKHSKRSSTITGKVKIWFDPIAKKVKRGIFGKDQDGRECLLWLERVAEFELVSNV